MGKRGPKPKHGMPRTPSGRIRQGVEARCVILDAERNENQGTVKMRRMRDELDHNVLHPLYGWPIGKLALLQIITPDEFDAGRKWAELTFKHAQIVGLMLPKCKAID